MFGAQRHSALPPIPQQHSALARPPLHNGIPPYRHLSANPQKYPPLVAPVRLKKPHRPGMSKRALDSDERTTALSRLRGLGGITARGLDELLKRIRDSPEILDSTRRERHKVHRDHFKKVRTEIQVPLTRGGNFAWPIAEPNLLVQRVLAEKEGIASIFEDALKHYAQPWNLIIGFDEFAPGDKKKCDNRRKSMVLNFSFAELGPHLIHDAVWFTPVVVRSKMIEKASGGWSNMLRMFLRHLLWGTHGVQKVGIPFVRSESVRLIHAKVAFVLSDGDGLRIALDWKGHSQKRFSGR